MVKDERLGIHLAFGLATYFTLLQNLFYTILNSRIIFRLFKKLLALPTFRSARALGDRSYAKSLTMALKSHFIYRKMGKYDTNISANVIHSDDKTQPAPPFNFREDKESY